MMRSERSARALVLKTRRAISDRCPALLGYSTLAVNPPMYLTDYRLISDVRMRRLRSTDTVMCVVRRSHNIFGVLQLQDHRCGTRCPLNYDNATVSESSNSC